MLDDVETGLLTTERRDNRLLYVRDDLKDKIWRTRLGNRILGGQDFGDRIWELAASEQ
jgi:hypothetical protein